LVEGAWGAGGSGACGIELVVTSIEVVVELDDVEEVVGDGWLI
jgi:hypothetical protein